MKPILLDAAAWRGYRSETFPAASWSTEGDVLHALPHAQPVSLVSREVFEDFELAFEWRLPPAGNSGVLYRVREDVESPWQSGPEMQLLDDAGHPDGRAPETRCGALYGLYAPTTPAACEPGAFHSGMVRVRGDLVEHWLNGTCVLRCDLSSGEFGMRVGRSKFGRYPHFARAVQGYIVLQHHGEEAWFRNLRIR